MNMMPFITNSVCGLRPSATLAINETCQRLIAEGRQRTVLWLQLACLLSNTAANFALVPEFAGAGAGMAKVLAEAVLCIGAAIMLRQARSPAPGNT